MKANTLINRDRFAAVLTLVVTAGLLTYAATGSLASTRTPAKASTASKARAAAAPAGELLYTTNPPVNGEARAADEPPSRSAIATVQAIKFGAGSTPAARTRTIRMEVTAYCPCKECCGPGARGLTASGRPVSFNSGRFVAADTSVLPFGTKLIIPGYNRSNPVPVADRGGAIQGRRLDLFFPTHSQALKWGRQILTVTIVD